MRRKITQGTLTLAAIALSCPALQAQAPSYFPLQVGNSWLYRQTKTTPAGDSYRSISVEGTEVVNGREYFRVNYFGNTVVLREDPATGTVTAVDLASEAEKPWLSLGLPQGSTFPTTIDACAANGTISSRTADVTTPAGTFNNVVTVSFTGHCADAGITQEGYAPNVGPVFHEETSFAGPHRYELVYYHTGTGSGSAREISFTLALDSSQYEPGANLGARLTLRSTNPQPIHLQFPGGQSYDLKIYNQEGKLVYTWSEGRMFTMIFRDEMFGPGERTYGLTASLLTLPPGRYKAQAYLTTAPVMFLGEAAFEITGPSPAAQ